MVPVETKQVICLNATISSAATTSAIVDRLGFNYASFSATLVQATATNSSAKWLAMKLMHANSTAVSNATNINGYIGTTNSTAVSSGSAVEFVIPANNSTTLGGTTAQDGGGQTVRLNVNCTGLGRYLFFIGQGGSSHSTVFVKCDLTRAETAPDTSSEANVATLVNFS